MGATGFFADQTSIEQQFGLPPVGKELLHDVCASGAKWHRKLSAAPARLFGPAKANCCVGIDFGIYFSIVLSDLATLLYL